MTLPKPVVREDVRPDLNMDYLSPLEVPESVKKDGFSYAWVRKSAGGEDDFRVEEMAQRGWTPVPAERCVQLSLDPLNRNPLSKNFVCYKDVLLMERPAAFSERENQILQKTNRQRINSLRGVQDDLRGFNEGLAQLGTF